jgi:hypothetical protein
LQIGCDPRQALREDRRVDLCHIIGITTGIRRVRIPNSETAAVNALSGEFHATNFQNNKQFYSRLAYLPHRWHDPIVAKIQATTNPHIEFGYEFAAQPLNASQYVYEALTLI